MNNLKTFPDVFKDSFNFLLSENLNTGLPGVIHEVQDYKKKMISVKPLIKKRINKDLFIEIPIINNVPVIYPESDTWMIKPPLAKGMKVWLVFSQLSMDNFLSSGDESLPDEMGNFSLSDAVAFLGFRDFKNDNPLIDNNDDFEIIFNSNKIVIKKDNSIILQNENGTIKLNSNGQVDINNGNLTVES